MCKQGAYEAGRRRQKEENYKEKLYRRLKQQWIGPYKPFDVDDDWSRQYYPEEYGSDGVYMARDCAYVEERCREHKNKEIFGYVDYGYSDLFKPAVEKMLVADFKQQVKEYHNPPMTCYYCKEDWYCCSCFEEDDWAPEDFPESYRLAYELFKTDFEETWFAGHDDWYEYDERVSLSDHYDIDYEKDYCWRLHCNDSPTPKLWYKGECRYPKMQPKSYYDYDELDWEEDEVWYVSFKVVVQIHPDCDYSLPNLVEEEEEEEHFNYDSGLKQGCERNQSRRIKEYNYKQRLDRRFKHLIGYNPYQCVGYWSFNPDLFGDDGTFLSKGSRHREELTRDERQAKYLRCYGFEKGWSDRKQTVAEKVARLDFKQHVDELFSFDYEEMYYNPDDDLMLGCNALDVEWVKRTYGYDVRGTAANAVIVDYGVEGK